MDAREVGPTKLTGDVYISGAELHWAYNMSDIHNNEKTPEEDRVPLMTMRTTNWRYWRRIQWMLETGRHGGR